jgi:hypothetical protein
MGGLTAATGSQTAEAAAGGERHRTQYDSDPLPLCFVPNRICFCSLERLCRL